MIAGRLKYLFETVGDYLSNMVSSGLIRAALLLPYDTRVALMGKIVDRGIAPLAGWRRRIRNNLKYIFPDMPADQVDALTHQVPDTAGRMIIEMYSGAEFIARHADAPISGEGLKPLIAAHRAKRPVILVTGHYANYLAMAPALEKLGIEAGVLYRPMANRFFNAHYVKAISAFKGPRFPQTRQGLVQMVRHLRSGGVIGILTDLHAHDGARLTFMGKPAASSTVTAELALKHDALMVPVYGVRQPNGIDFTIEVHPPIAHSDPITMTQQMNDDLETMVRRHPEQWFWIHKRWKID